MSCQLRASSGVAATAECDRARVCTLAVENYRVGGFGESDCGDPYAFEVEDVAW